MYKGEIIHAQLLRVIAEMGHTNALCICDAGLPIPKDVERVDLALKKNMPGWLDVCKIIYKNMVVEKIFLAKEMVTENPDIYKQFREYFKDTVIELVTHEELKIQSGHCWAVVRTGEFSSYCNCIFVAGVNF